MRHRNTARAGRPADDGFTIIEVLVASTLLLIGALATLMLLDNGARTTALNSQRDTASALAQELVERASGGRYTPARNDMTDVDPGAAAAIAGPADRLRRGLDPDGRANSTPVVPATSTTGAPQVDVPQRWTLTRLGTPFTVSYRACTTSDARQGVLIAGPYDCTLRGVAQPPGPPAGQPAGSCSLGLLSLDSGASVGAGTSTLRLSVLGFLGLNVCAGALSQNLAGALCGLLGSDRGMGELTNQLLNTGGGVPQLLGGLLSAGAGGCPASQVEQALLDVPAGIATTTKVAVTVDWPDREGRPQSIQRTTVVRRPAS